ncbi:hypothetical protein [Fodinibius sp.]|uniref:hypothetical protein n=1 Tax=Fodinibius sp. TaxID=1872440 RepID=UPI002ACE9ABA|nr:hypothetical protein [Fodinibius sp.]MDZ7659484.1 hypothetical protein [Fodinibius sp.]
MWIYYLLEPATLPLLFAIWIFFDSQQRNNNRVKWTLGAFFLTPFVVPNYFAKRNLKEGEVRKGGRNWHRCKYFTLYWTLFMVLFTFFSRLSELRVMQPIREQAFELFGILMLWIIPAGVVLLVGIFLKKPSKVEKGPTGSLA